MSRAVRFPLVFGLILLSACAPDPDPDPGRPDSGVSNPDAGKQDAAAHDSSVRPDAGDVDSGPFEWPVPTTTITITPHASWKNRITRDDPFVHSEPWAPIPEPGWVKFAVLMRDPSKVYFQDSGAYPFHYEFATERLDPFLGLSRAAFDQQTLHRDGQELILGAILFSPLAATAEYGIQLVRQDAYHPEMARIVLDLVKSSVDSSTNTRVFYFPTYEQANSARENEAFFEAAGFPLGSADRWVEGDSCYSYGWALGALRYVPPEEVEAAYADGRLGPNDVLLTDSVPAELPFVAGITTIAPSTPNSHVAILAKSYGVPFVHLARAEDVTRARSLAGRDVVLRAEPAYGSACAKLIDAGGKLDATERAEILALKTPPAIDLPPKMRRNAYSASTEDLGPDDARYFGGKAAHFGLIRDAIQGNSPSPAIAFSFDLFDDFLAQTNLRQQIDTRLAQHTYPPNITALRADLAAIRTMIEDATFPNDLKDAVVGALQPFDASRRIRFRSSTNVEDAADFTGAGLYDSISGCLADDTDADAAGPSICDTTKVNERGALRAIKKVYASFYNDNAVLERLRHNVDESRVAMGILAHYSHLDSDELANGVATLRMTPFSAQISLVTQAGAFSVSNPEGNARAEVVDVYYNGSTAYPELLVESSLVPIGGAVMEWPRDYEDLSAYLYDVAERYRSATGKQELLLDLEYKKMRPDQLVVKQVREVPQADPNQENRAFLIDEPYRSCTFQGEAADVWSNHRLKSRWTISTDSRWIDQRTTTPYGEFTIEYLDLAAGTVVRETGPLSSRPGFVHAVDGDNIRGSWDVIGGRRFTFAKEMPPRIRATNAPLRVPSDFWTYVETTYSTPQFSIDWMGPSTTTMETIRLGSCPEDNVADERSLQIERVAEVGSRRVTIRFVHPEPPRGASAGYTAPLWQWRETTIEGFTARPIVLRGYWSQTYRPGHHNFSEEFIFEPRLEEGIDPALINELEAANIRLLHVSVGGKPSIGLLGSDGMYRVVN